MKKPDIQQVCQAGSFLLCGFLALQITSGLEGTEFSGGWLTGPLLSMEDIGAAFFHRRCCPDVCVPPSCRRNWACFVSALFAALCVLYCSSPMRSNLRTRARVQGPTSSRVSLAYVASDRAARPRCYALRLHSPCRSPLLLQNRHCTHRSESASSQRVKSPGYNNYRVRRWSQSILQMTIEGRAA